MALVDTTDGMPMGLAVIAQDPTALDRVQDPAAVMVALVEQARTMLAQASGMEGLADVIEWKSRAEAIRVYTQQKDMGHEAELSAAEIVRRAERRIGQLVREAQEAGEVFRQGQSFRRPGQDVDATNILTATEAAGTAFRSTVAEYTTLADKATDDEFEQVIAEAKDEGNLSRANVVRKVKGDKAPPTKAPRNASIEQRLEQICAALARSTALTSTQIGDEIGVSAERVREIARQFDVDIPADRIVRRQRIDPNYVLEQVIDSANPSETSMALIVYGDLDRERLDEWVSSLSDAIRSLQTIKRNLQKELTL